MKQMFLILALFTGGSCILALVNTSPRSIAMTAHSKFSQDEPSLKLDQIEGFIKNETPDTAIAAKIKQRGVSFEVTECRLQRLRELAMLHEKGPGVEATIQALRDKKGNLKFEEPSVSPTCSPDLDSPKYGFEKKLDIFWEPEEKDNESRAVIDMNQSLKGMAYAGCYSLRLVVDLVGGHSNNSKGAVYVNLGSPIDLENVDITVRMRYLEDAVGDVHKPNGAQVFVKDKKDKGEYGTFFPFKRRFASAGQWVELTLKPTKNAADVSHMDPGFNPQIISAVGVQIAAGGKSKACYSGPIYVDSVDWKAVTTKSQ